MKTSTGLVAVGAYTVGALVAYRVLKSARDADADSVAHWLASGVRKSFLSQLREVFGVGPSADADDANGGTTRRGGDANEREVPFVDGIEDRPAAERAEDASAARGVGAPLSIRTKPRAGANSADAPPIGPRWDGTPVPEDFLCPVGRHIMHDPVVCGCMPTCGATFDRANVSRWIDSANGGTCPNTGRELRRAQLFPNRTLRGLIEEWSETHGVPDDAAAPEDVVKYVDPPLEVGQNAARRRRLIESSDDDDDGDDEYREERALHSLLIETLEADDDDDDEYRVQQLLHHALMTSLGEPSEEDRREQFPIARAYQSMNEEDVTESRPGAVARDIRSDLASRGFDVSPTFESRVEGLDPVDTRLDVPVVNIVVSSVDVDDEQFDSRYVSHLYPDVDEWSERDRMILREVIRDMFSKRLVHIREALHEGRCTGGDIVDDNNGGVHSSENNSWIHRAIPWLCVLVNEDNLLEEDRINAAYILRECVKGRMTETEKQLSVDAYPHIIRSFVSESDVAWAPDRTTSFPMDGKTTCLINLEVELQVLPTARGMLHSLPDLFPSTMTERNASVLQNAMVLILWDLLVEQLPPVTDANTQRLHSEWFGWETPMLARGIYWGLYRVIEDFLKNHDRLEEEHLIAATEAAENAKCVARMLKELVTAIPEGAAFLTHDDLCCIDMQERRKNLLELEIPSPRARR